MKVFVVFAITALFFVSFAEAISFSVDPGSIVLTIGPFSPADIFEPAVISIPFSDLGLAFADDVSALSFGDDFSSGIGGILFSVDRGATGAPGSALATGAALDEAAADVYFSDGLGGNTLVKDEEGMGLIPGVFGDNIDALEFGPETGGVYFGLAPSSPSGGSHNIYRSIGDGSFSLFASGASHMGLGSLDSIVALALSDGFEPGILNPGIDSALLVLDPFSPAGIAHGAFVLGTDFTGPPKLVISFLGLGVSSGFIDGLDVSAAPVTQPVPEPGTWLMFILGACGIVGYRYRLRR
jgi:hypothetical protein